MTSRPTENTANEKEDGKHVEQTPSTTTSQSIENDAYAKEREIMGLDALEAMYEDELCH